MTSTNTQHELSAKLINAILKQIKKDDIEILPYPVVATRLRKVMDSGDFGASDLEEVVKTDQALAATVLRHGNAAAFRGTSRVSELGQAISRIGATELERVVLAAALGTHVCSDSALRVLRFHIWRDALLSAHFCQLLAKQRKINPREAFLCGLLHDLGLVVAVGIMETIITEDEAFSPMPAAHWKQLAQEQHVELGLVLANRWELPEVYSEVISRHHEAPSEPSPMVELVRTVDDLVDLLNRVPHLSEERLVPLFADEEERKTIWSRLGTVCALVTALGQPPASPQSRDFCSAEHSSLDAESAKEAGFTVTLQSTPPVHYTAQRMDQGTIQIVGKTRQQTGTLVKIALDLELERLEIWAKVAGSSTAGKDHRVELTPFGLDTETKGRWDRILKWLAIPAEKRQKTIQHDVVAGMIERLEGELSEGDRRATLQRADALVALLNKRNTTGKLDQEETAALGALRKALQECKARKSSGASRSVGRRSPAKKPVSGTTPDLRWVAILGLVAGLLLVAWLLMHLGART